MCHLLYSGVTEYAEHIAEAAVEQAVGFVVVKLAVGACLAANGKAYDLCVGRTERPVAENVPAAGNVAEYH